MLLRTTAPRIPRPIFFLILHIYRHLSRSSMSRRVLGKTLYHIIKTRENTDSCCGYQVDGVGNREWTGGDKFRPSNIHPHGIPCLNQMFPYLLSTTHTQAYPQDAYCNCSNCLSSVSTWAFKSRSASRSSSIFRTACMTVV